MLGSGALQGHWPSSMRTVSRAPGERFYWLPTSTNPWGKTWRGFWLNRWVPTPLHRNSSLVSPHVTGALPGLLPSSTESSPNPGARDMLFILLLGPQSLSLSASEFKCFLPTHSFATSRKVLAQHPGNSGSWGNREVGDGRDAASNPC